MAGRKRIEQQMQMLQWQKMQTEQNIRVKLAEARAAQERDIVTSLSVDRVGERSQWVKRVVDDEMSRPADSSVMVVSNAARRSKDIEFASRLDESYTRHSESIARLKLKALENERNRLRMLRFKAAKRSLGRQQQGSRHESGVAPSPSNFQETLSGLQTLEAQVLLQRLDNTPIAGKDKGRRGGGGRSAGGRSVGGRTPGAVGRRY